MVWCSKWWRKRQGIILREMIEVREGRVICDTFKIGDVDFIINDLCIN